MGYQLLSSPDTVIVYGPQNVQDAMACSIISTPSGSRLFRVVPKPAFDADLGKGLLTSLSDAVEQHLQEDFVIAASGGQGVDDAGLLYDFVRFTVTYAPAGIAPGEIVADVEIPVNALTADTQFGGALNTYFPGTTLTDPAEALVETYNKLVAMSSG